MELRPAADQQARKIRLQNPFGICSGDGAFIDALDCIGVSSSVPRKVPDTSSSPVRPHPRRDGGERPSRSALYGLATKHKGLFKKAGSATIVDLNMLADIIAELPDADINISASKSDPEAQKT
jgi:hypothetical protein